MGKINLNDSGKKKINLKGQDFTINWEVARKSSGLKSKNADIKYYARISIPYISNNEKKWKTLNNKGEKKEIVWEKTIAQIKDFIDKNEIGGG